MTYRQSKDTTMAAAKSGFSRATGYRIADDPRLPSQRKRRAAGGGVERMGQTAHVLHPLRILGRRERDHVECLVLEAVAIELCVLAAVNARAGRGEVSWVVIPAIA